MPFVSGSQNQIFRFLRKNCFLVLFSWIYLRLFFRRALVEPVLLTWPPIISKANETRVLPLFTHPYSKRPRVDWECVPFHQCIRVKKKSRSLIVKRNACVAIHNKLIFQRKKMGVCLGAQFFSAHAIIVGNFDFRWNDSPSTNSSSRPYSTNEAMQTTPITRIYLGRDPRQTT